MPLNFFPMCIYSFPFFSFILPSFSPPPPLFSIFSLLPPFLPLPSTVPSLPSLPFIISFSNLSFPFSPPSSYIHVFSFWLFRFFLFYFLFFFISLPFTFFFFSFLFVSPLFFFLPSFPPPFLPFLPPFPFFSFCEFPLDLFNMGLFGPPL